MLFAARSFAFSFRPQLLGALLMLVCLLATPVRAQDGSPRIVTELTLGVLASEGATRALEAWTPTLALLNQTADRQQMPYRFKIEPHTDVSLINGLAERDIDLLLGDPATFVVAEVEEGVRPLMSVAHMWQGITYDVTGAVVFARADSGIRRFSDMEGRRIMGVYRNELTGWKLALQEFRKYRIDPESIASDVLFSGGNQREVIYAVQNGLVDIGVIRAGVLETLAAEGVISLDDFRPISPIAHSGFPFWASTPLYPDWVLAAMPDVPEDALGLLIDTLLKVDQTSAASVAAGSVVWQAPQNYQSVHELLISLRARPYENHLRQAAVRIYHTYKWPVRGVALIILLSIVFLIYEVRRNAVLTEAQKDVLKSEVRSKQFYRNAIEDHTVFCMLTKEGVISHVNQHFLKALDRTRGSLMNNPLSEIMTEANQEAMQDQIMAAMEAGVTWQGALQLTKADGQAAWVQSTFIPVTGASNKLSEIAIVASDVTQTRAGVSEKRFNNTLELIQDQVVVMRPSTLELMYVNSAAEQNLVAKRLGGNWKGKKASDFITDEDLETLKMRCEAVEAGPQRRITWEVEGKNDVTYEISLEYAQPDQDEPRLIAIYRDVSERKVIEKAKNEFIATVSHELRTPLTSMKGALGLAQSGALGEVPDKMTGVIDMAATSCDRLVVLINDILDLEKIEAGKMDFQMQPFDLNELLDEALQSNAFYAEKFGVAFERIACVEGETFMTYGDPARLAQVMDNLMSNAAKFSDEGSEIQVSVQRIKDRLRIAIRDHGEGIPARAQATIFDKFTQADSSDTRSKGGTGLGLSIVKLIVETHQGRVSFVSEEGNGTEFFVDLPMVDGETVVEIPLVHGEIETPRHFSDADVTAISAVPNTMGETAIHQLVEIIRREGAEVDFELGRIRASQLAKGRGVVGTSSALNWMGAGERTFLDDLLKSGAMADRDVCVIDLSKREDTNGTMTRRSLEAIAYLYDWLQSAADLMADKSAPTALAITSERQLQIALEGRNFMTTPDSTKARTHRDWSRADLLAQFATATDAATLTLYPTVHGKLPDDWPLTLIVSRAEAGQSERGVVSKFSSGGGGRRRA